MISRGPGFFLISKRQELAEGSTRNSAPIRTIPFYVSCWKTGPFVNVVFGKISKIATVFQWIYIVGAGVPAVGTGKRLMKRFQTAGR